MISIRRIGKTFFRYLQRSELKDESLFKKYSRVFVITVLNAISGGLKKISNTSNKVNKKVHLLSDFLHNDNKYPLYPKISNEQISKIEESIKISFVGDLILLKEMVENGYKEDISDHDFSEMFSIVKNYWKENDFNIGVFEGPVAGEEKGFSSSNYGDGFRLFLNFPKAFSMNVKEAGIDVVTLANNHLLDQGIEGYLNTLQTLDEIGLPHIGAYRSEEDKNNEKKIFTIKGKRIALLAYTYGSNYCSDDYFFDAKHTHITNIIASPDSNYYKQSLESVAKDFASIKTQDPDTIIVLPHMGTQFKHYPDYFQKTWVNNFVELGADVILSDHPHATQPVEWIDNQKHHKKTLVVNSPGNFINSFTAFDGDASYMAEIYLTPDTSKPIACSIIPIYAYGKQKGNYIALPIYNAIKDASIFSSLSKADFKRLSEIQKIITKSAYGVELTIDQIQKRYYSFPDIGYMRNKVEPIILSAKEKDSIFYKLINQSSKILFVGDSVTEGTMNGGYGWFEPLMEHFSEKNFSTIAKGSETSTYFMNKKEEIASENADLYVFALGCNDIRYRTPSTCAMDEDSYISNIKQIINEVRKSKPEANIVFISPWQSLNYDPYCPLSNTDKDKLYHKYSDRLERYCKDNNFIYINPNPYIMIFIRKTDSRKYMKDWVHPNADEGILLYSKAVINASIN